LRKLVWGHRYLAFLATAPVAIPGIVLAVGLFLSYTHPPLVLYGTLSIIFLAYLTKELPVGYQQIAASLKSVHPELEDASRIVGDARVLEMGMRDANVQLQYRACENPSAVDWSRKDVPLVDLGNLDPAKIERGKLSPEAGRIAGETLATMIDLALAGELDGITF